MAVFEHSGIHRPQAARSPFDQRRSTKLDQLIIKLDDTPPRLRARIYRLHKRFLDRRVPALYGEVR